MGTMFGTMENYGEMFQDSILQTRGASLSSTNPVGIPVVYKLVRVARDGRLVPATDEEILEVRDLLENSENEMPDEGSPSRFLQLDSLEGLFESETAEACTENLSSRLESKEELMCGSQMLSNQETKFQNSNELSGNVEQVQPEVLLQEPIHFSSNECNMDESMDMSPHSTATGSPKEPAAFSRVRDEKSLDHLSIKSLQETFRATFGRDTTCKDKQWLKRRITMGLINSCVVPTPILTIKDNKLVGGDQDGNNDMNDGFSVDIIDEGRATNCKDAPSSPDYIKGHSNGFGHSPVETVADHYSGNEDFDGEHRSAKRVRKPTKRYIEEISKTADKQEGDESMVPSKGQRSVSAVSSGGRVVVTRMVSLAGSRVQVPYVSHGRRSRPRENIMALGEFHSSSWEVKATPEERKVNLSSSQLNNDANRIADVKSASGPVKKEDHSKPISVEVVQEIMEPEHLDSSGDSSDGDNNDRVELPITQSAIRRKHHRAWTLSEVTKLVEGVSKYGVGKWSEIKRLSFTSHSHRTSVDLKDKWRNLLKASFAQNPSNRVGSVKKQGSMAIPSQILLKVRELAQKQSLVSPLSKTARMVKESRNGFL